MNWTLGFSQHLQYQSLNMANNYEGDNSEGAEDERSKLDYLLEIIFDIANLLS